MIKEIILNDGSSILCDKFNQLANFVTITKGRVLEEIYTEHQIYKPYVDRDIMSNFAEIKFWLNIEKYEHEQLKEVENVKIPYSSIKYVNDIPDNYLVGDLKDLNVTFQMVGKDKEYSPLIVDCVYRLTAVSYTHLRRRRC